MITAHEAPRGEGVLDRIARRVLPPLSSLGESGTFVTPLSLILLSSVTTTAAMQAWGWDLTAGSAAAPPDALKPWLWVLATVAPLLALVKAGIFAMLAWGMLVLAGSTPRLRPVLSALLYGEAILALQGPALFLVLRLQGGLNEGPVPVSTGLDAFVDGTQPALLALARGVTPFHIGWVAFLALAFASCAGVSRARGLIVSASLWLLVVGLGILRALLSPGVT